MDPELTLPPTGGDTAPTSTFSFEAFIGRRLADRYVVTSVIGTGGMGAVFAARDERLGRDVAVKVVRPALAHDATAIARFVREARAAAGLAHPAIVTIFDAGWNGDVPFIVMEKLTGTSLADRLHGAALSPTQSVRIVARLLEALSVAHAAGIVHRDIKPANIFLCAPHEDPKLVDFGVASVLERESGSEPLTADGSIVGTPLYLAPEHFKGATASPRDDVYALGAVLYEAIARRPIYAPRTMAELFAQKISEDPAPVASVVSGLAPALAAAIDRALSREPSARFASADAMRTALLAAIGEPVSASAPPADPTGETLLATPLSLPTGRRPAPPTPTPSPVQRTHPETASITSPRTRVVQLVAVGAIVALAAVGTLRMTRRPDPPQVSRARTIATLPPAVASTATETHPLVEPRLGLRTLLDHHDASGSRRSLLTAVDAWTTAAEDFARASSQPGAPAHWHAAQLFCEGRARLLGGSIPEAVQSFRAATTAEPDWATAHVGLADAINHTGDLAGALAEAHRAEQLEPTWWVPLGFVGAAYSADSQFSEAVVAYRRALALAPGEPAVLDGLALALAASGNADEAARIARTAIERDPESPWSHLVLAERALAARDAMTALAEASRAASVQPHAASPEFARGDALVALHRNDEAREAYRRALQLADETHQRGLPEARVVAVREAMAHGRLPRPRFASGPAAGQRTHAPSRPSGGSHTRSPDDFNEMGL